MDFLTEVDKLVQLIECPIFTCERSASGLRGLEGGGREPSSESSSWLPLGREREQSPQGCF